MFFCSKGDKVQNGVKNKAVFLIENENTLSFLYSSVPHLKFQQR